MTIQRKHWSNIGESTFIWGIQFFLCVYRLLGRTFFELALYPVIFWYVLVKPIARRSSKEYLTRLAKIAPEKYIRSDFIGVFSHFMAFGRSLLDRLCVWKEEIDWLSIRIYGHEPIQQLVEKKQGCLLICSHMGNIELAKALSTTHENIHITMLVHTKHAQKFNVLLKKSEKKVNFDLIEVSEVSVATTVMLQERIAQGEFIIMAGDRVPVTENAQTVVVPFLGEDAPFAIGPFVLASLLACPVFMMTTLKRKKQNEIWFELFREQIVLPSRKNRHTMFVSLATDYAKRLQKYCLMAPNQWFNFYAFWSLPDVDE